MNTTGGKRALARLCPECGGHLGDTWDDDEDECGRCGFRYVARVGDDRPDSARGAGPLSSVAASMSVVVALSGGIVISNSDVVTVTESEAIVFNGIDAAFAVGVFAMFVAGLLATWAVHLGGRHA